MPEGVKTRRSLDRARTKTEMEQNYDCTEI